MQTIKQRKWMAYTAIGIYLLLSPFMGFPIIIENAIFVVLGAVLIWLGTDESKGSASN